MSLSTRPRDPEREIDTSLEAMPIVRSSLPQWATSSALIAASATKMRLVCNNSPDCCSR